MFEDVRHERSMILLISLTDPDVLKQSKFTDDEIEIIKNLALEKIQRQRILKENVAMDLLQKQIYLLIIVSVYIFCSINGITKFE